MQSDMIEPGDPLFAVFGSKLRRATFTMFTLTLFAATDGVCKDNTSQDHFRSVNLYKEFAYKSEIE